MSGTRLRDGGPTGPDDVLDDAARVRAHLGTRTAVVTMSRPVVDVRIEVDRIPGPGEKTLVRRSETTAGGTDGNIAAALAHLGVRVAATGSASTDDLADVDRASLEGFGVDVRWDGASAGPAVVCHVVVDPDGERAILVGPATDDDRVTEGMLRSTAAVVGTHAPIDVAYLGVLRHVHRRLAPLVRPRSRVVAATIEAGEPPGDWFDEVAGTLDLVLAAEEAFDAQPDRWLGLARRHGWALVVTRGARGCTLVRADGTTVDEPAAPLNGPVRDTTGAGDAFAAGLLAGIAATLDVADALGPAAWFAARAVEGVGPRAFGDPEGFAAQVAARAGGPAAEQP